MKQVVLENISVSLPPHNDRDALTIKDVRQQAVASILMDRCTVRGGSECVFIDTYGVHLRGCHISGAENRGIFANNDFVIEDSVVKGCGGYGMKTRAGCERRGKNTIQTGPWDGHMQRGGGWDGEFGGMGAAGGGFGFGASPYGITYGASTHGAYDQGSEGESPDDDYYFDDNGDEDE